MTSNVSYIVTGAAGVLGGAVTTELIRIGAKATGLGRRPKPSGFLSGWSQCDLTDRASVGRSLADAGVIIHCASSPFEPKNDRAVMQNLIAVAKERGCHIVYASICSMESVADYNDYYKAKLADERDLEGSGISHSIVRISQFHPFVSRLLSHLVVGPFMLAPKLKFQPVDVPFAAQELCRFAMERTERRTPDIHGPETLTQTDLIPSWLAVQNDEKDRAPCTKTRKAETTGKDSSSGRNCWGQNLATMAHGGTRLSESIYLAAN